MKTYLIKTSASATLMALALCLTPQARAADTLPRRDAQLATASGKTAGHSARDIIGQDVRSSAGEDLGEVKDLILSPVSGKIAYALLTKGGVLGVGEKIRAVPFSAFKSGAVVGGALTLDVDKAKWDTAPTFRDDDLDLLGTDERGRSLFEYYGQDWNREMLSTRTAAAGDRSARLLRVSTMMGKDVKNAGQEVGEVEDVIVDFNSRRAAVLLDPEDDYTGTDKEFLIGLDQIMHSPDKKDDLATTLTRAEFDRATPARDDWSGTTTGYPYVWSGYHYTRGVGYSAVPPSQVGETTVARDVRTDERREMRTDDKLTVASVREALSRDPALSDAARQVILREEGRKLVIRGTVPSKEIKNKIADRVEELAKGWNVDDEMEVKAAAE